MIQSPARNKIVRLDGPEPSTSDVINPISELLSPINRGLLEEFKIELRPTAQASQPLNQDRKSRNLIKSTKNTMT